jgi:hypothetical protein
VRRRGGKGVSHHLASQTGLTDGVRLGGRGDFETSDQVVFDHLPQDRVAGMAEALVPEGEIHGEGGGRGEVCCLWDGDGGALEVGNGRGVHLGLKHDLVIKFEGENILFDVDEEVPVHGEEED